MNKSYHQQQVESFMLRAGQEVPVRPTVPSDEVRILRAKLILEEALETIQAMGVSIEWDGFYVTIDQKYTAHLDKILTEFKYEANGEFNLAETIDGCCDLRVVTTGTLSACGIPDMPFQEEVDRNNLLKFGPGYSKREDGKLIKPPGHKPPRIKEMLSMYDNCGASIPDIQ